MLTFIRFGEVHEEGQGGRGNLADTPPSWISSCILGLVAIHHIDTKCGLNDSLIVNVVTKHEILNHKYSYRENIDKI